MYEADLVLLLHVEAEAFMNGRLGGSDLGEGGMPGQSASARPALASAAVHGIRAFSIRPEWWTD